MTLWTEEPVPLLYCSMFYAIHPGGSELVEFSSTEGYRGRVTEYIKEVDRYISKLKSSEGWGDGEYIFELIRLN